MRISERIDRDIRAAEGVEVIFITRHINDKLAKESCGHLPMGTLIHMLGKDVVVIDDVYSERQFILETISNGTRVLLVHDERKYFEPLNH